MSKPLAAVNVNHPLVDKRVLPLGRKCLLKQLSVMVDTWEPESRRHGTGTPPSFTVAVGHFPTALWNTSPWLGVAGTEPKLSPSVAWLFATEGASLKVVTWSLFLPSEALLVGHFCCYCCFRFPWCNYVGCVQVLRTCNR